VACDCDISSPAGSSLDVKKSSYKKLSKFLAEMQRTGFVQVKELSKGVESIIAINQDHSELVLWKNLYIITFFCFILLDVRSATKEVHSEQRCLH